MGLDWHAMVKNDLDPDDFTRPCVLVNAPRLKDLPDFAQLVKDYLDSRQQAARKNKDNTSRWLTVTVEELMEQDQNKFFCQRCPLLLALDKANSMGSPLVGFTVLSCDFRGKMISSDEELPEHLTEEAYTLHTPEQMLDYADRLEALLPSLKKQGLLKKLSYDQYVQELADNEYAALVGEQLLSREAYEAQPHWREQNIREAVHWLRTCASYGVTMDTSY